MIKRPNVKTICIPKIHKHDFGTKFQFRPIFTVYNYPCFKIAKFIYFCHHAIC